MSADGKIADDQRSPARFGSECDRLHLEARWAEADAVLIGAGTLRSYGTTLLIRQPHLVAQRRERGQPSQPVQIVCSASGQLNPSDRFFSQPVTRWLLTSATAADQWRDRPEFEHLVIASPDPATPLDLRQAIALIRAQGIQHLVVGGGGQLVSSLLAADLVDDLWLTVCPLLLGGRCAPTPLDGSGYAQAIAPRLALLSVEAIADEVFLHYQIKRSNLGSPSPLGDLKPV